MTAGLTVPELAAAEGHADTGHTRVEAMQQWGSETAVLLRAETWCGCGMAFAAADKTTGDTQQQWEDDRDKVVHAAAAELGRHQARVLGLIE
ncbi:hypothetical protein SEA_SCHMIDT_72 [Gordonia phage Schmidt]|uniref:Uncharacterized protein n=1 Tax=Gordonia phage Schmidt TaxID=2301697 RepID=A0A385E0B9_9CAUD|nr:hypothetical protein KDJ59_gp72 [Gordonia phage Schmidt]AXQ65191.1 hypothetical protein SEA_SCHMIDT_72 [Gordonia phage Schmidt]